MFRRNSPACVRMIHLNQDYPGIGRTAMKRKMLHIVFSLLLLTLLPVSAYAISLEEAAQQAARQNNAKVLSARTVQQGDRRVHEIKLLTKDGVVKTVRIPDNSKRKKR